MKFNVAQLLKSPVGASRRFELEGQDESLKHELNLDGPLTGSVRMDRTNTGILCTVVLAGRLLLQCGRCLEEYSQPIKICFSEEFIPLIDIDTGLPFRMPRDADDFVIDESHVLDLTDPCRQYGLLEVPLQPLCRADCQGLCPTCGVNRNREQCNCVVETTDPRLAVLESWFKTADE